MTDLARENGYAIGGEDGVKVWDVFVRVFHWGAVVLVVSLVLTAHFGLQEVHMSLGIDLLALTVGRLAWGVIGTAPARFGSFVTHPRVALRYLGDVLRGHPKRYLGHNPAGGLMVVALLSVLAVLLVTGLLLQATLEFEGPFVGWFRSAGDGLVDTVRRLHYASVHALYLLVPLHLLGVLLASRQHRENLAWSMVTGYKSSASDTAMR